MILLATRHRELLKTLKVEIKQIGLDTLVISTQDQLFETFLDPRLTVIVIDEDFLGLPRPEAEDAINKVSSRVPVIVLRTDQDRIGEGTNYSGLISDQVTFLSAEQPSAIFATVAMLSGQDNTRLKALVGMIPYFHPLMAISRLRGNGGLGILCIDASNFSRVGLEYGMDVYRQLREVFLEVLFEMWGKAGNFRENDIICQRSTVSNVLYVFLSRSREAGALPLPGSLEKMADRVGSNIQNRLLMEMSGSGSPDRRLPVCIRSLPSIGIGFASMLYNPCIEVHEIVERGIEASIRMAQDQLKRVKERHRELMQVLIQSEELLYPNYQAVFRLQGLTQEMIRHAAQIKSIRPLKQHIYGFESLIRLDQVASRHFMTKGVIGFDPKYLRPDLLFTIATESKVALELDQTCLRLAVAHAQKLPGTLMINILPRNFYYIEKLIGLFGQRGNIILEISESENINNFELFMKACAFLKKQQIHVAADDFGKGYSSLERVLKIRPAIIKFDRSIVSQIHNDPIKQAYVKGLVDAARHLSAVVLAEGIEKWEEAKILQQFGVELIQGFLLHFPQEAGKISEQIGADEEDIDAVA